MSDHIDWQRIFPGIDAHFCEGYHDGRILDTPTPSANRHPAYRHSWEVGRAEIEGRPIPAYFSRTRAALIEAGGAFYPYIPGEVIHDRPD